MWWIIILGIIVFSIFKFMNDNNEQANAVAKQGGMRKKYSLLVDYLLSASDRCRIMKEGGTYITLGAISPGGKTIFDLTQTFGSITITWTSQSVLMGNHKLTWEFGEFEDQSQMIARIQRDINSYMNNVINKYK